jgi:hypothetical protein
MWELAESSVNVHGESWCIGKINEFSEVVSILFGDCAFVNQESEFQSEDMLSVVLPYSLEVRLV